MSCAENSTNADQREANPVEEEKCQLKKELHFLEEELGYDESLLIEALIDYFLTVQHLKHYE